MKFKIKYWLAFLLLSMGTLTISIPTHAFVCPIENDLVSAYRRKVDYRGDNYIRSHIDHYAGKKKDQRSRPQGAVFRLLKSRPAGRLTLIASTGRNYKTDTIVRRVSGRDTEILLDNLLPNKTYYYKLLSHHRILRSGRFVTTGQVRFCSIKGVRNVRDIGGWTTGSGQRIRYGMIYRGGELDVKHKIRAEGRRRMLDELNIMTEIDLRKEKDFVDKKGRRSISEGSALGERVAYYNYPIRSYKLARETNKAYLKEMMQVIFQSVRQKKPIYIHCIYGADRTGTVVFLLQGLLGVGESDLAKDYELTSFYVRRNRTQKQYAEMIRLIKSYEGKDLSEQFANYFRDLGITDKEIFYFRKNMLE